MIHSQEMTTILRIVKKYLNKQVVFAEQDKERPKDEYVSLYMIGQNPVGRSGKSIDKNGFDT